MSSKTKWVIAAVLVLGIVVVAQASVLNDIYMPVIYVGPTITPIPTATPKPTELCNQEFPNTKIKICFTAIDYKPIGSELDEWVDIKYTEGEGQENPQDMTGWRISSDSGNKYDFPDGTEIKIGQTIRICTSSIIRSKCHLYMNRTEPFWNDNADYGYLMDDSQPHRQKINSFCYGITCFTAAPENK